MNTSVRAGGAFLLLFGAGCSSEEFNAAPHPQPGEITVSAAYYSETSASVLAAAVKAPPSVNPHLPRVIVSASKPVYYLFAPGEIDQSDVAFPAIAKQLATALAAKGYIEASSAARTGGNPQRRVDWILRVHCGERYWRDPKVRTTDLTWDDGLAPKASLHSIDTTGNSTVWDYRAGGDDASLVQIEEAIGKAASPPGAMADVGPNDPANPMSGLSTELTVLPTRDFFLVVVEAFDFKTLRRRRGLTPVLWTTFVALPKSGNQTFSQVLPALLRAAGPYFGTTSQGLAVFNDDRAKVESGAPYVVP